MAYRPKTFNIHPDFPEKRYNGVQNYRTIAQISHTSKVMVKVKQHTLLLYMEQKMLDIETGLRKGRGTQDIIVNIHWILECSKEFQKKFSQCFMDYSKAFVQIMQSYQLL